MDGGEPGHLMRMEAGQLPEKEVVIQRGCRKRPLLRWEDCVKRDVRKAEDEDK